jgi:hypothetical protein
VTYEPAQFRSQFGQSQNSAALDFDELGYVGALPDHARADHPDGYRLSHHFLDPATSDVM